MFELVKSESEDEGPIQEPAAKKNKSDKPCDFKRIHSSLNYSTIKAPPFVEYKSINSYCDINLGKSLVSSSEKASDSPSTSGLNNIINISSPIVFKTPKTIQEKRTLPGYKPNHYSFFSVEELSLVKSLKHWNNTKVCAVGQAFYESSAQQCYVQSIMEKGQWRLLLDTSLLPEIPTPQQTLQFFGHLNVTDEIPRLKLNFCRNLASVELPLFIESYTLMQKYVPKYVPDMEPLKKPKEVGASSEIQLNDTLDDYNFSDLI